MSHLEKTQLHIGYIPLLDCIALLWAKQRGFFDDFGLDVNRELRGRAAHRLRAFLREAIANVGQFENRQGRRVEFCDDVFRRANRNHRAVPRRGFETGITGFRNRRHLGRSGRALETRHAERAHLAGFKLVCAKGAWLFHSGRGHIVAEVNRSGAAGEAREKAH